MYSPDETDIRESHFELLAEHGEQVALIATVNLDVNRIVSLMSLHEYDGTFVVQSAYLNDRMNRVGKHSRLLTYFGDAPDVVRKVVEGYIDSQEQSDDETQFTWELITGNDVVQENEKLAETLETVINPERLDPDFDIPEGEPIAVIDVGSEGHHIIKEANDYKVGAPVDIHRHRGDTYIIGLTEEYATAIANAIHDLQMEYRDGGHYDSAEVADTVEGRVLHAETEVNPVEA